MVVLYCPPNAPPAFSSDDLVLEYLRRKAHESMRDTPDIDLPSIPPFLMENRAK